MTPWHRFWFPQGDDASMSLPRDAALWTPQALAETQRAFWQQAALATEDWWRFWCSAWPGVPAQPPAGVVLPTPAARPARPAARPTAARKARAPSKTAPPRTQRAPRGR